MYLLRPFVLIACALLGTALLAHARPPETDSLQNILAKTPDEQQRIQLLLNLKDLNEATKFELPFSIQLFREAAVIGDTYAMSTAAIPIVNRYATYSEKSDTLRYYLQTLRKMTPNTAEEGIDDFNELLIGNLQITAEYNQKAREKIAHQTIAWSDSLRHSHENQYARTKRLTLEGYARAMLEYRTQESEPEPDYATQAPLWEEAYALTKKMPSIRVRTLFAKEIYYPLSIAYNQQKRFSDLQQLIRSHLELLDSCKNEFYQTGKRPHLYFLNTYVLPYQQLMRGAINVGRQELAEGYFQELRTRLLRCGDGIRNRNRSNVYEVGYLLYASTGNYSRSLQYCDSLVHLINRGESYFSIVPDKVLRIHHDQSRLLYQAGQYDKAYAAFERTAAIQDSLLKAERFERAETIRLSHNMDRMMLEKTREIIRNRLIAIFAFAGIGVLLFGLGIYLFRSLRHNHQLQSDILRHNRKAQESERMKSTFVNTICRGIEPPLERINHAAHELLTTHPDAPGRTEQLGLLRASTKLLLSTLDNLLEAANLESLSGGLQLENTNIDEVCRAELLSLSRLKQSTNVEYRIEAVGTRYHADTHVKYFSFVVRALLDNAAKFTHKGSITLRYEVSDTMLQVVITDTGCGIPPERRKEIFRPLHEQVTASRALSLALCNRIANALSGTIRLDEEYTDGARFIFTIPAKQ